MGGVLPAEKVGCGDHAQASRDEMGRIADVAATQRESKQRNCPERTFEAGLRWFCAEVKANVAWQMNGGGMMQDHVLLKFPFTPRIYFTTQSDCEVSSKVTVDPNITVDRHSTVTTLRIENAPNLRTLVFAEIPSLFRNF